MIQIQNEEIVAAINPLGAELSSLCSKKDGYEYLWQGDPAVWTGRSPLLFPIVGGLRGGRYTYRGSVYEMEKHGFAQKECFRVTEQKEEAVSFCFDNWQKHYGAYPFRYCLKVEFRLNGRKLQVFHRVERLQDEPMYFSIGAHPGFRCLEGGYIEFPFPEDIQAQRFNDEKIIRAEREPFLKNETIFRLNADTFLDDAYILEGLRSPYLFVRNPAEGRSVRVDFGNAPVVGLWAKPGAEYVCVEPWCGIDDDIFQTGAIEQKKQIVTLDENQNSFTFFYEIELID